MVDTEMERRPGWTQPDAVHEPLYVVTPVFNQLRWKSRWKHYIRFAKHVVDSGAVLCTVEAAFGARDFALAHEAPDGIETWCPLCLEVAPCRHHGASRNRHRYLHVRTAHELWLKENLINIGVSRLPHDWKYVAWIDADIMFLRPNWVSETIHQLQHYAFLQMFSHAVDLDPGNEILAQSRHQQSFMQAYMRQHPLPRGDYYSGQAGIPGVWTGLAWACTREAWDAVGGLMDFCIHGGGDWHTAFALIGRAADGMRDDLHPAYRERVLTWAALAERHIRRNVGMMTGTVAHRWHGKKRDRRYRERHTMLAKLGFDPSRDLKYDWQGLLQLVDHGDLRSMQLRDVLREHARARCEDSIDID